ncbi:hypothetical protein Lal_00040214 [Lupinus albus]|nr:hypothetical protein Lal_00040214 [Lupinus albus]
MLNTPMTQLLTNGKYLTMTKIHTIFTFYLQRDVAFQVEEITLINIMKITLSIFREKSLFVIKLKIQDAIVVQNCLFTKRPINFEEHWVVTYFSNSHNHTLLDDIEVRFLSAYHDIPSNDQNYILLLCKVEACHFPYLEKDIRNFLQSQSSVGNENDASDIFKLYTSLKDIDDAFKYDFTKDESNKLEHIIWVFGYSIRAYEIFGDVEIDNHGNSILVGCVLLRDEKILSFRWDLKSFLHFVKGKYPRKMLMDQDHAFKEAIFMELSNTKHAFCIYILYRSSQFFFSFSLGPKYDDFKSEFYTIQNMQVILSDNGK